MSWIATEAEIIAAIATSTTGAVALENQRRTMTIRLAEEMRAEVASEVARRVYMETHYDRDDAAVFGKVIASVMKFTF